MQRSITKQVLFILSLTLAFVLATGISNVKAQERGIAFFQDWDWDWEEDWGGRRSVFDARYNRVEGLYTGVRLRKEYWQQRYPTRPFLYGLCGYSFSAKEFQFQLGLEKGFFDAYRLAFGGEYHRIIDTPDRWIIPDLENSLAAFLLKEDFQDFYLREGSSGYISQNFTRNFTLSVAYHYESFDSLKRNTKWALFGGKKQFRENPPMSAGEMRSVVGSLVIDSRNSIKTPTRGWYIQVEGEHAGDALGGNFEFDRLLVDLRRYQPLWFNEGIDCRLRVGTSSGDLPWQKRYHLGGLSTLRGFPYKAFPNGPMSPGGNRMILAQLEYRMGAQDLPDELGLGIFDYFNIILFADVGWVDIADRSTSLFKGFENLSWSTLKSDAGIALTNRGGDVRFEIARRTDTGYKPFTFCFRINRPF